MKLLKINLRFKSFYSKNFTQLLKSLNKKIYNLGLNNSGVVYLPRKYERYTVLRSPHIDKKSREQFEKVSYNRLIILYCNPSSLNFLKKLKILLIFLKNSCGGLQIKLTYFT